MTARADDLSGRRAAVVGMAAAGVALGVGEAVAGLLGAEPAPVAAVGSRFVDRFAGSLEQVAVAVFGTDDKTALVLGTVVIVLALGAATGVCARRRPSAPTFVFVAFGAFGAWAQASNPQVAPLAAITVAVVSVAAGLVTFHELWHLARPVAASTSASPSSPETAPTPSPKQDSAPARTAPVAEDPRIKPVPVSSRRRFLTATAAAGVAAVGFAAVGRALMKGDVVAAVKAVPIPRPGRSVAVPVDTSFRVPGATPYVTQNADFYRIDTALDAPRVDATTWRLDVAGMVDHELSIDYRELLSMPSVAVPVTLQCVSNEVGGDLVGNATWQGVPLPALLERAGVRPGARQVFSRSVDGWTSGFPLGVLDDGRPALVAYAMNGRRLPVEHGFPARLVVAGLYGYVSATKWLRSIELTTWDGADGYWIPRGWSKEGPIKLASRIDVPADGADVPAGPTWIAGVAWQPTVGVRAVQISIDDGPWQDCELGPVASEHTWVQWRSRWAATPGEHDVRVRAVDGLGRPQIEDVADPAPDGATGLHHVGFTVGS